MQGASWVQGAARLCQLLRFSGVQKFLGWGYERTCWEKWLEDLLDFA